MASKLCSTPEYRAWGAMLARCYNPKNASYDNYHSKGITVCEEWKKTSKQFLSDVGKRPSPDHSLDRIDNSKGYYKENCRWATRSQQQRNKNCCKSNATKISGLSFHKQSMLYHIDVKLINGKRYSKYIKTKKEAITLLNNLKHNYATR